MGKAILPQEASLANLDMKKPLFQATLEDLSLVIEMVLQKMFEKTTVSSQKEDLLIYNNESLKKLLGVQDKLIQKYRDEGYLGYSKVRDKFWYTQKDVEKFLENNHFEAYQYEN